MFSKNYLKIISLGGFGNVTKNMFVYETERDIIIVDCGVGFPEEEMLGVDLVIPDISYLLEKKEKIKAMFLTHGHEDHIGALSYILPSLKTSLPIFTSKWARALAEDKLSEFGIIPNIEEVDEGKRVTVGDFSLEFVKVTHSIPDTMHLVIKTPVGIIYHAADFKLDLNPVMGRPTNQELVREIGSRGVLCMLSDSLRSETPGFTPPETKLEETFENEIRTCSGKFIVTTMSSNISRLKQAIDVSRRHNRKIVFVGRSVEKNIEMAQKLGYVSYPKEAFIPKKLINKFPPSSLTLMVAGSQGQVGSALDRLVGGEIEGIKIKPKDKIVFSSDAIPGNETAVHNLIDDIYRLGAEVVYSDIRSDLHVSGHGAQGDLSKLMEMVKPKYLVPIGGNYRHMIAYRNLAVKNGYREDQVIIQDGGKVINFNPEGQLNTKETVRLGQVMVDALGIGDVGNVVLRDRKILSEEGMVIAIVTLDQNTHSIVGESEIVTRGFIYVKENFDILNETKRELKRAVKNQKISDVRLVRQQIQGALEKYLFKKTGRRPMILVVIIEI